MTLRLRFTLLVPLVSVGLYTALRSHPGFIRIDTVVMQAVSLGGSLLATLSFSRGDYLRRAWGLYFIGDALFLVLAALAAVFGDEQVIGPRLVIMLLANAAGPAGSYLFGSAWALAGLEVAGGRWTRRSGMLVGFVVGCLLAGPALYGELGAALRDGNLEMLSEAFGTIGDLANLTFTAPIILTALALRGGQLAWVWSLLSTSLLLWLGYDILSGLALVDTALVEGVRMAALSFSGAAGLAQHIVTRPR